MFDNIKTSETKLKNFKCDVDSGTSKYFPHLQKQKTNF